MTLSVVLVLIPVLIVVVHVRRLVCNLGRDDFLLFGLDRRRNFRFLGVRYVFPIIR